MGRKTKPMTQRFPDRIADVGVNLNYIMSKIGEPDANGCIPYHGVHHKQGYGFVGGYRLATNKKLMMTVHRLLMKQKMNSDLAGQEVIHSCGNMWCCNVNHLFIGNETDIHAGIRARGHYTHWSRGGLRHELEKPRKQKYRHQIENIVALYKDLITIEEFMVLENCTRTAARKVYWTIKNGKGYKWVKHM